MKDLEQKLLHLKEYQSFLFNFRPVAGDTIVAEDLRLVAIALNETLLLIEEIFESHDTLFNLKDYDI